MAVQQELSISDPRFNVREIAKQLILLEQHLLEKGKYCPDCITKHILTVEALADECQTLDEEEDYCFLAFTIGERSKLWAAAFSNGEKPKVIGQDVRAWRKKIAQKVLLPAKVEHEDLGSPYIFEALKADWQAHPVRYTVALGAFTAFTYYYFKKTGKIA